MNYPPPPATSTLPPMRHRGRRAIQVGIALMAIGGALFIAGVVVALTSFSKIDSFQRVRLADRSGTVTFTDTGGYTAYYEATDIGTSGVPLVGITMTSPSGATLVIDTPYGGTNSTFTYHYGGYDGIALYTFHISETGVYQVELSASFTPAQDGRIAFGGSIAPGHGDVLLILSGILLGLGGLVTLIVGLVRGSRHKRELATAAYWQQQPWQQQPWQQPWQQQPWQQQPWQQQPWQQQPWQQQPWQQPPPAPPPTGWPPPPPN